ncbi:MAG: ribonuclease P protein component [Candidatus Marinamargulisbacteria bacterium]
MKLTRYRFKKNEISKFLKQSFVVRSPYVTIHYQFSDKKHFAFVCPKRNGNAVKRNKIKRQLKALFCMIYPHLQKNISLILIAKKEFSERPFQNHMNMLLLSLKKSELTNETDSISINN